MLKLYLKKLFLIIGFFFVILGVFFPCYFITSTIANLFQTPFVHYIILMGVPTVIVLKLVYKGRTKNQNLRNDYIDYISSVGTAERKFKLESEIIYLKSFQPLQAEILAFATIILPFVVAIGISVEKEASFMANFLTGIIVFSLLVCVYLILDVLFWIYVHKKWLK
ncbi:MAG: hypothetical protein E7260_08945 [Lachnospiraceae bacterium]|nr:hypothetical protein [Lachnospiraceae bacterium]